MGLLSIVPKLFGYAKRAVKAAPEFILGTGSETVGAAMRAKKGSIFTKAKAGALALEKDIAKKSLQGGFFKRTVKNLITTPKSLVHGTKVGARAAKIAGKSSFLGGLKGLGKGIAKKMPFIGALLTIGFELPNIFKAGNKEGTGEALKETGKAVGRLAGGAAGAAIGSAICPGIGSLIGWVAGEWLTSKIVGKSYTEKKAEEEQKAAEQMTTVQKPQVPFQGNNNQYAPNNGMTNPFNNYNYNYNDYMSPYANDIMMQQMNFSTLA